MKKADIVYRIVFGREAANILEERQYSEKKLKLYNTIFDIVGYLVVYLIIHPAILMTVCLLIGKPFDMTTVSYVFAISGGLCLGHIIGKVTRNLIMKRKKGD